VDKNNTRISLDRSRADQTRIMDTKKMKQLQDLLDWLDSFEKLPFEPTRQNVVEKIWQLQSEIELEEFAIHNVSQQRELLKGFASKFNDKLDRGDGIAIMDWMIDEFLETL